MERDEAYYEAHAHDVDLNAITSSDDNKENLRMLRDNISSLDITVTNAYDPEVMDFVVGEGDDFGWLGYFIGVSTNLHGFDVEYLPEERERTNALFKGISRNRSIYDLSIKTDLMDNNFVDLGMFLRNNTRLTELHLHDVSIGIQRAGNLTLGSTSIRSLHFEDTNLHDGGFAVIAASLSKQAHLRSLSLKSNSIGATSCKTLGEMTSTFARLDYLDLSNNNIDDTGLKALVGGLANNDSLTALNLSGNWLITVAGLRSFSSLFHSESCRLEVLRLNGMNIGDDGAEALVAVLAGNETLRHLRFDNNTITSVGWSAFSRLLGDPSSINNTYLSNHTLQHIGDRSDWSVSRYLEWNRDKRLLSKLYNLRHPSVVPKPQICKILYIHRDLDIEPFFQYKLKFLPMVVDWLQRSAAYFDDNLRIGYGGNPSIECRELAAIFKFIRGKPQLVFDGYWAHVLKEAREKKRKLQLELDAWEKTEKNALKRVRR